MAIRYSEIPKIISGDTIIYTPKNEDVNSVKLKSLSFYQITWIFYAVDKISNYNLISKVT